MVATARTAFTILTDIVKSCVTIYFGIHEELAMCTNVFTIKCETAQAAH